MERADQALRWAAAGLIPPSMGLGMWKPLMGWWEASLVGVGVGSRPIPLCVECPCLAPVYPF